MCAKHTKVFISYTHEDEAHIKWVERLYNDLSKHDIDVILDRKSLKLGGDLARFMMKGIKDAKYVLIVCTPKLASDVETGTGGIGFEHTVILGEILVSREFGEKYIPLLRKGTPAEGVPLYLNNSLFVDFRDNEKYEEKLKDLLIRLGLAININITVNINSSSIKKAHVSEYPEKWIKVAGTGVGLPLSEKLQKTSQSLGELLARNGYGLITGGWPGVDYTVSSAFAREIEANSLPLENFLVQIIGRTDLPKGLPKFTAGELVILPNEQDKYLVMDKSIERADAVILIGGRGSTRWIGFEGLEKSKPVFPLADTGSDAKDVYLYMIKEWSPDFFKGIDKRTFQIVAREAPGVVNRLLPLLKTL